MTTSSRFFLHLSVISAVLLFPNFSRADSAPFYLKDGDKVVFYGDSITEQRLYTTFTETYVITRFPNLKVSFVHSGWGGDRVGGGGGGPIDHRLERDVFPYQPTVVTIMLGMNDGGYHGFDQATTDTYQKGYTYIVDQLQAKLPGVRLTLIQPSPHDDVTRPPDFAGGGYNAVLEKFAEFVKDLAEKDKQTTTDFNTAVVNMLTKAKETDPALAKQIIPDRVHPNSSGHLIMAETLLKTWNAPSLVTDVEIDAAAQKVVHANNAQVTDLKNGETLTWTQTDGSLPMPVDPTDPNAKLMALAIKSSDFTDALNREPLVVTGLKAPFYQVNIDDEEAGTFSREDLAKGINLATLSTPMMEQAIEVHKLTLQHNDLHFQRWRNVQCPLGDKNIPAITQALPPILAALDDEEKGVIDRQRAKAQPKPHHYELTPQETAGEGPEANPTDSVMPTGLGPNLALNKKFVSSNPNPGWDSGLTDGSYTASQGTTYATGDDPTFPKTVTIDLEKNESLGYVVVAVPPFGATKQITVSLSTDNQTFTKVGTYVFPQNIAIKHLYTFPAKDARYVRLTYNNHYSQTSQYGPLYGFTTEAEAYAPLAK